MHKVYMKKNKSKIKNDKPLNKEIDTEKELIESNVEELKKECEDYKEKWLRAQADYQNYQKQVESNRTQWIKMIEVQVLEDFIPIYDNFKKAIANVDTNSTNSSVGDSVFENWKKGIEYIMKQFESVLKKYNIEEIKAVGEVFNPEFHEAVGQEESEKYESDVVIREVDSGYKAGDRVIKAVKVIVSK